MRATAYAEARICWGAATFVQNLAGEPIMTPEPRPVDWGPPPLEASQRQLRFSCIASPRLLRRRARPGGDAILALTALDDDVPQPFPLLGDRLMHSPLDLQPERSLQPRGYIPWCRLRQQSCRGRREYPLVDHHLLEDSPELART